MSLSLRYACFILFAVMIGALVSVADCLPDNGTASSDTNDSTMSLTYYTTPLFPPFEYIENGTLQGISIDLLKAMSEKTGKSVAPGQLNKGSWLETWNESYQIVLSQNNTFLFTVGKIPEREQDFKWAGPIYTDRDVLFAKKDRGIVIKSPEDLKEYRIGFILGFNITQQLLDIGVNENQLVRKDNISAILTALNNNEIDLWVFPETPGIHSLKEVTGNYSSYAAVYKIRDRDFSYAFNKNVSDSVVESFQQALDSLKQEKDYNGVSEYDRIIDRYILSTGLENFNPENKANSSNLNNSMMPNDLVYYTEQLPPYNYMENGTLKGVSVELLEAVTEKLGKKVSSEEIKLAPWTEGYQAALKGNNTVLFTVARTPEREQAFKWAGPIYMDRYVLFAKPDRGIDIRSPDDLKGYRIGVITDDAVTQQLLSSGVNESQIVSRDNVSALVNALENGETDLWAYSEFAGRYFTEGITGDYYSYTVVYKLEDQNLYYAFSKDVPDSVISSFQQALDSLKQEKDSSGISQYDRILGQYIPSIGLANLNYLTEEFAPFNYKEGEGVSGASVELLEEVFKNMGVSRSRADVRHVSLAEGFQAARNNTSTVLFSIVRTPEREPLYKWAGPIAKGSIVLYAPKSKNIIISSSEDLNKYRIGAITTSVENNLLIDQGVNKSQIINNESSENLLRMLDEGQMDLWAIGDIAGRHQILKSGVDTNSYEIVYTLSENNFYYIFSKDVPDTLVNAFNNSLKAVRNQKDEQGISAYERIIYKYFGTGCARQTFTNKTVMKLVNTTAAGIEKNASDTFRRINAGEAPYLDKKDPALYVFVYDLNTTLVANAINSQLAGENFKGKTDATGKPYRDEIQAGALKNGTGWVDYVYMHPVQPNLYNKTTYYRLIRGSDGNSYIVCSGNYKPCQNQSDTDSQLAENTSNTSGNISSNNSSNNSNNNSNNDSNLTSATGNNSAVSPEELVAFVEKAFEYAHVQGQEAALKEFNNQTGQFADGELYIFAYDLNGTTLALPFQPEIIGTNRWNITDANGTAFVQELIATAQSGGGFVEYFYADPADNFTVKQKLSYVMMVNQSWILGAGIYNPQADSPIVKTGTDPKVRAFLKSFVGEAIAYANTNGKDSAISEFNNVNGTFVRGNLYIYAFDYNGTTLALPYQPEMIGKDLSGLQDPYGVNYTRVETYLAEQGGGFIFYHYYNPARNMTLEPKMSYVQKVDDAWWLGAGTYIEDLNQTT